MSPLMYVRIAVIAAIALAGFGAGWTLNGWRLNAKIGPLQAEVSRLQARSTILESANAQCEKSILTQNEAVKGILAEGKKREERAAKDAAEARRQAAWLATDIAGLRATARPVDSSCAAQTAAAAKVIADEIRSRAR